MTKPASLLAKTHFCFCSDRSWDDLKTAYSIENQYRNGHENFAVKARNSTRPSPLIAFRFCLFWLWRRKRCWPAAWVVFVTLHFPHVIKFICGIDFSDFTPPRWLYRLWFQGNDVLVMASSAATRFRLVCHHPNGNQRSNSHYQKKLHTPSP